MKPNFKFHLKLGPQAYYTDGKHGPLLEAILDRTPLQAMNLISQRKIPFKQGVRFPMMLVDITTPGGFFLLVRREKPDKNGERPNVWWTNRRS